MRVVATPITTCILPPKNDKKSMFFDIGGTNGGTNGGTFQQKKVLKSYPPIIPK
jgi:hypothetical protein